MFLGPCVRKGDEEKNLMFSDDGLCFSPSTHHLSLDSQGSRILKYAEIESDKFNGQIKKNSGSL